MRAIENLAQIARGLLLPQRPKVVTQILHVTDQDNPLASLETGLHKDDAIRGAAKDLVEQFSLQHKGFGEVGAGSCKGVMSGYHGAGGQRYFSFECKPWEIETPDGNAIHYDGDFLTTPAKQLSRLDLGTIMFWGCWATGSVLGSNFTLHEGAGLRLKLDRHETDKKALQQAATALGNNGSIVITSMRLAHHQEIVSCTPDRWSIEKQRFEGIVETSETVLTPSSIAILALSREAVLEELKRHDAEAVVRAAGLMHSTIPEGHWQALKNVALELEKPPALAGGATWELKIRGTLYSLSEGCMCIAYSQGKAEMEVSALPPGSLARIDGIIITL